ncbi:MAG: hypothetical protein KC589_05600 [Nanoarchaeota archaeon]|nr:hypothetical protein [Nanoarchaeota archaeon]
MKSYDINGKTIKFRTHIFDGKQSLDHYENQIYSALSKIGISKDFIEIELGNDDEISFAHVKWIINNKKFAFKCESQENNTLNLGAIAQAIHEDIRQITRGIKDLFTIMNQYEEKGQILKKRNNLLNFENKEENKNITETFPISENKIDSPVTNLKLDEKYHYLYSYTNIKLDAIYFRLKEQCIAQNLPNHPMLIALKIVRQKKGLKL